jgi:uncharacterized protein YlxW (UPF0749 family)
VALRAARVLVPVTALAAGLLFATSAETSQGTDLRSDRRLQWSELVAREARAVERTERTAAELRSDVERLAAQLAEEDSRIGEAGAPAELVLASGLTAVRGPGVSVTLDDAPQRPGRPSLCPENPDDCLVHEEDLQAVVNALRNGGAEAVSLMGDRIIATSAVRCVGNTVLLHGKLYSPPFVVTAIGDPDSLRDALADEPGVALFQTFVDRYGLEYDVRTERSVELPPYTGTLDLSNVELPESA